MKAQFFLFNIESYEELFSGITPIGVRWQRLDNRNYSTIIACRVVTIEIENTHVQFYKKSNFIGSMFSISWTVSQWSPV